MATAFPGRGRAEPDEFLDQAINALDDDPLLDGDEDEDMEGVDEEEFSYEIGGGGATRKDTWLTAGEGVEDDEDDDMADMGGFGEEDEEEVEAEAPVESASSRLSKLQALLEAAELREAAERGEEDEDEARRMQIDELAQHHATLQELESRGTSGGSSSSTGRPKLQQPDLDSEAAAVRASPEGARLGLRPAPGSPSVLTADLSLDAPSGSADGAARGPPSGEAASGLSPAPDRAEDDGELSDGGVVPGAAEWSLAQAALGTEAVECIDSDVSGDEAPTERRAGEKNLRPASSDGNEEDQIAAAAEDDATQPAELPPGVDQIEAEDLGGKPQQQAETIETGDSVEAIDVAEPEVLPEAIETVEVNLPPAPQSSDQIEAPSAAPTDAEAADVGSGEAAAAAAAAATGEEATEVAVADDVVVVEALPADVAMDSVEVALDLAPSPAVRATAAKASAPPPAPLVLSASTSEEELRAQYLVLLERAGEQRRALDKTLAEIKQLEAALGLDREPGIAVADVELEAIDIDAVAEETEAVEELELALGVESADAELADDTIVDDEERPEAAMAADGAGEDSEAELLEGEVPILDPFEAAAREAEAELAAEMTHYAEATPPEDVAPEERRAEDGEEEPPAKRARHDGGELDEYA